MYCSLMKSAHFWDTCDFFPDQHVTPKTDYRGSNFFQIYSVSSAIDNLRPPLSEVENRAFCWEGKKKMFIFVSHIIFLFDTHKSSGYDSNELECILKYCSCTLALCIFSPKEFWFHWLPWKKSQSKNSYTSVSHQTLKRDTCTEN